MNKPFGRSIYIFMICVALAASAIIAMLFLQNEKLENDFKTLIANNLRTYTKGQVVHGNSFIHDVESSLDSITTIMEDADLDPDDPKFSEYLEKINQRNTYAITYLSGEELATRLAEAEERPDDKADYIKILNGETVISNIYYSTKLNGFYFAIGEPISQDGEVTGALRVLVNGNALASPEQGSQFYDKVLTCVIDSNGKILYTNAENYQDNSNLSDSLKNSSLPQNSVDAAIEALNKKEDSTFLVKGNDRSYHISIAEMGCRDWRIVNILRSTDIISGYDTTLQHVLWSSIAFVLVFAIVSCLLFILIMRQRNEVTLGNKRYEALSLFSDTVLLEYDCKTDSISFTPNATEILELKALTINKISDPQRCLQLLHPDDSSAITEIFHRQPESLGEEISGYREVHLKAKDGVYKWFSCQYKYIYDANNIPSVVIGKLTDISKQVAYRESLKEKARIDYLTNTYNKSGEEIIDKLLAQDPVGSFFMLDLDNFKEINDSAGHIVGDSILVEVGNCLNRIFRPEDVVARIGGDEFIVFSHGSADKSKARKLAQRILKAFDNIQIPDHPKIKVSGSIGVALSPCDGVTCMELYAAADKAMYAIKHSNKADFAFYEHRNKNNNKT